MGKNPNVFKQVLDGINDKRGRKGRRETSAQQRQVGTAHYSLTGSLNKEIDSKDMTGERSKKIWKRGG